MLLLICFLSVKLSFFITIYCKLFFDFGSLAKERLINNPTLFLFLTPLCFWISAYMCRKFAFYAAGNSMEHIKNSITILQKNPEDFKQISPFLNFKVVFVKAVSSLVCCFGGGSLGAEGPAVHMSAGIFASTAHKLQNYLYKLKYETWIFAGSAAGIALAFNAPIAGFVYAIEKLSHLRSKSFKSDLFWTFITLVIVSLILHKTNAVFVTPKPNFEVGSHVLLFIFMALFCGVLAFLFKSLNSYFFNKIANIKSNWWHLFPILGGFLVAIIGLYSGIYSFSSGVQTVNYALENQGALLSYKEVIGRILNTIISFVSGCAGGLIAPSIAIGAGIGSIFSTFMTSDIDLFIIVGMTAFLSAILGEPIAAAIIIFEATKQPINSIPFLLLGSFLALLSLKNCDRLRNNLAKPKKL